MSVLDVHYSMGCGVRNHFQSGGLHISMIRSGAAGVDALRSLSTGLLANADPVVADMVGLGLGKITFPPARAWI